MDRGNLKLRKWSSNCKNILDAVPKSERDTQKALPIHDDEETIRTIGLLWQPSTDTFGVSIVTPDLTHGSSKRKVLSSLARIFDPLGWLSPVTIRPKIIMQEIWKSKLDWDSPLPDNLHRAWTSYCNELETLNLFKIDRCILRPPLNSLNQDITYELHGFCDSSQAAYAACVYVRTVDSESNSGVTLVIAKTKLAPVKTETIPRLELCGAVLLSKLMNTVQQSLKIKFVVICCWTDSTIVLDWLHSTGKLPIFVANRVRKIEAIIPVNHWHHVDGKENPADPASRGILASSLVSHKLWFKGPNWLSITRFPVDLVCMVASKEAINSMSEFLNKCSSFTKMRRVIAFCLRFIQNGRTKKENRRIGPLSVQELSLSLTRIILCIQAETFNEEIKGCQKKETIKSRVKFLSPFLDGNGILRVGGRLEQSSLSFEEKHPILPYKHKLTENIFRSFHISHLHAGPQLLLAVIRRQFWIVNGTSVVKQIVRRCIVCHRQNPRLRNQQMAHLPSPRVHPSRPFSQCGVDYAGPYKLCVRKGRHPQIMKSYVSLFIRMATRAIHLELVSELTTPAFNAALTRFSSRRGLPSDIYCDGGSNFEGAKNEMEQFIRFVKSNPHNVSISSFLADKGVTYHFNPPYAPHHGGLWKAGVKSMKKHLKRVIEDRHLTIEEFSTLLCQVESCLNSRPMTQLSSDPNDCNALTPAHFLVGDSLQAIPQQDLTHSKPYSLSRWQMVQVMYQHFWKRWHSEYIGRLQSRPKWIHPLPNLGVGTLVLICDDDPVWGPQKWKLGRISAVHPGLDGMVRVCDVKVSNGTIYRRPIVKLSPLPIYP